MTAFDMTKNMKVGFYRLTRSEMKERPKSANKSGLYWIEVREIDQVGFGGLLNLGCCCLGFYVVNT